MKKNAIAAAALILAASGASALPSSFGVSASFSPNIVGANQSTTFNWNAAVGAYCEVEGLPGGTRVGRTGSYTFTATESLTAHVSCEKADTFAGKSATLTVSNAAPVVSAKFTPSTVYVGGAASTFSWSSTASTSCSSPQNGAVAGTAGSIQVPPAGSVSDQSITVNCSGPNGTGTASATLSTGPTPIPPPTVFAWASPSYLTGPGFVSIGYSATGATSCWGAGGYYVSFTTAFQVGCTGPGGTTTAFAWVTVAMSNGFSTSYAPMSTASKDGRPVAAKRALPINLAHLGIDLSKKRFESVEVDMNKDGVADLLVVDKLKEQAHILLGKNGQYPSISKTVDKIGRISQIKGVFVPLSNAPGEIRVTLESQQ